MCGSAELRRSLGLGLLLLLGALDLHTGTRHHPGQAHDRLLAPEAAHPATERHLEASGSILERGCALCATAARRLAVAPPAPRQDAAVSTESGFVAPPERKALDLAHLASSARGPPSA